MKRAIIFAAVLMAGITLAGNPADTQAAPAKNVVIKKAVSADGSTLKENLTSELAQKLENCTVITIPCVPGVGGEAPDVPDSPDLPDADIPDNNRPGSSAPDVPDTERPGDDGVQEDYHAYVLRVVGLVNEERAKAGLSPLTLKKNITAAAQVRAAESERLFSHTRPDGRNFATALTEAGVNYRGSGENIAWGQKTPEQVMDGWMNSAGHRANILNAKYTSIGVGYYQNTSGVNYWSQLFTYS